MIVSVFAFLSAFVEGLCSLVVVLQSISSPSEESIVWTIPLLHAPSGT